MLHTSRGRLSFDAETRSKTTMSKKNPALRAGPPPPLTTFEPPAPARAPSPHPLRDREATRHPGPPWWSFLRSLRRPPRPARRGPGAIQIPSPSPSPACTLPVGRHHNRITRNLGEEGLPSADRNNKATLLLTGPFRATKSYAKDSSPRASKLQFANHHRDTSSPVGRPPAKTLSRSLFLSV